MKALVLGGEGMLGHKIVQALSSRFPATACTIRGSWDKSRLRDTGFCERNSVFENVDATDVPRLVEMLEELRPSVVVNCIGIIKQRRLANEALPCILVNALLPHVVAEAVKAWGGRLIHFSTDCVFSGRKGAYKEDDVSDAEDLYGKSKFLGEIAAENALTLRTSIIGRELSRFKSLLEWFLSQEGGRVRGYCRVIYSGVTTNYLARLVLRLMEEKPELHGLYQVASEPISKHDLLCHIREAFGLNVVIERDENEVSDRSMLGERFALATGIRCPSWAELVAELAADPTPYVDWRR